MISKTCIKKLIEESGLSDEQELDWILQDNNGLDQLHDTLFFKNVVYNEADLLEAEMAYAAHFVKMQIDNQFDKTC
jgi:hypothetical protein